jgi:hypothetical protein
MLIAPQEIESTPQHFHFPDDSFARTREAMMEYVSAHRREEPRTGAGAGTSRWVVTRSKGRQMHQGCELCVALERSKILQFIPSGTFSMVEITTISHEHHIGRRQALVGGAFS